MRQAILCLEEQDDQEQGSGTFSGFSPDEREGESAAPLQTPEPKRNARETLPRAPEPGTDAAASGGLVGAALEEIGPSGARSFPMPVHAAGGFALLLKLAAAISVVVRRIGR